MIYNMLQNKYNYSHKYVFIVKLFLNKNDIMHNCIIFFLAFLMLEPSKHNVTCNVYVSL